jgi:hypothetical protein
MEVGSIEQRGSPFAYARRVAFARRRTDGAGGFFGIERMSNGIGGGGVLIIGAARLRSSLAIHYFDTIRKAPIKRTISLPNNGPTDQMASTQ